MIERLSNEVRLINPSHPLVVNGIPTDCMVLPCCTGSFNQRSVAWKQGNQKPWSATQSLRGGENRSFVPSSNQSAESGRSWSSSTRPGMEQLVCDENSKKEAITAVRHSNSMDSSVPTYSENVHSHSSGVFYSCPPPYCDAQTQLGSILTSRCRRIPPEYEESSPPPPYNV